MQVMYLEILLFWGCGVDLHMLVLWSVGDVWRRIWLLSMSPCLLLLLECMFDARAHDLSVERLIWEVWRCLSFKAFDLRVLSVREFIWLLWICLNSKSTWLERLEYWEIYLRGLQVFRFQKHMTWVFWEFEGLCESIEGV